MQFQFILSLVCGLLFAAVQAIPTDYTRVDARAAATTTYDFIIAGGGISGMVLGNRLTENPNIKVLVIEAGPFDPRPSGILVPGSWDPYPWFFPGLKSKPLTALNNRVEVISTANLVGGGSTINAMNWIRGASVDYDDWESLGNDGWGWSDLLPYFLKTENFTAPSKSFASKANISWDPSYRGEGGPIQFSYANTFYPGSGNFWSAAMSTGLKPNKDPNGGVTPGLFWPPVVLNVTNLTRCDSRAGYYETVKASRPNWQVMANTRVTRVLFSGTKATGVEFMPSAGGPKTTALASKEVIVAAGALHTPQVLQLSGIGPKALLQSLKIPVISDLPGVGSNFQDQTGFPILYNMTKNLFPNVDSDKVNSTYNSQQLAAYNAKQISSYTIVRNQSTNFMGVSLTQVPGYQDIIANASAENPADSLPAGTDPTVLAGYKAQRALILKEFNNTAISSGIMFWDTNTHALVVPLKPLSRGSVLINSTDPTVAPLLDYRTATDPNDFKVIVALFRKMRQVFAAPDLAALGPVEISPGSKAQSDDQIIASVRSTLMPSNSHQCCSAPMMPQNMGGVVCNDRKVYGVQNLRVGDVSAFPFALSAGPTPSVYASAEKLADIIKQQWKI